MQKTMQAGVISLNVYLTKGDDAAICLGDPTILRMQREGKTTHGATKESVTGNNTSKIPVPAGKEGMAGQYNQRGK